MTGAAMTVGGTAGLYRGPIVNETPFSSSVKNAMGQWKASVNPLIQGASDFQATVASIDPAKAVGAAVMISPIIAPLGTLKQNPEYLAGFFVPQRFPIPTHESLVFPWKDLALQIDRALTAIRQPGPSAYQACKAIGEWLGAGDEEVADAVGIGRTTPYAWRRDGREPRRGTAQRIYEFHAVLNSVRRELGQEKFALWLFGGDPSRRELLLAGDLESLEASVDTVLFERGRSRPDLSWSPEDTEPIKTPASGEAPRPSRRRPRRARLK
jgi:hypothetical protein